MKKALTVSLLALLISQGAAAAEYTLNNASMALSFNDADSSAKVKDEKSAHQLSPQELFFSHYLMKPSSTPLILK